jgi:TRAP-type uncharacterized transport system substrate-binding protein
MDEGALTPVALDRWVPMQPQRLPLHPGAIRYYRQIGRAGQTD